MRRDERFAIGGDRAGDLHLTITGEAKPPVLGRRTLRVLCCACLAVIVYGTLGPLQNATGLWVTAVQQWQWVPPITASDADDVITNVAVYVPVGIAFRLLVRRRGQAGWRDLLLGLVLSLALSYLTEVLQQALPGRVSSLTDVFVNAGAALLGCLCATRAQHALRRLHAFIFVRARTGQRLRAVRAGGSAWLRSLAAVALVIAAVWVAGAGVWGHLGAGQLNSEPTIDWAPFRAQFHACFKVLLADVLRGLAAYSVLTALCLFIAPDRGRAAALLLVLGAVGVRECARSVLSGHHADTTAPVLALVGWLVTTRVWASLRPRRSLPVE